ncbi:cytochrome bd-type quinol oxidase, subunit 1 [Caldisphaera lagunensis DSM 15908]|uniref:Cytochrome bd-type quinol oxidase, subunit 1 n=1 Tax=Caldisphaera lagunensis (strain DSM 15908 / JCM 11604 / ANMR 0165 / IC-154) TaxID=1056495 RepID=L0A8P3_CALLD|nr:cytochrome ubiquinol oxidase subunit I [Caldisphaera lagunensis]AFZ70206.1 cytochrome bd-type quinol oxidase, subunit 1 [Caldisphaera lagunensis DSM 15908]
MVMVSVFWLAFNFGIHIVLVNIIIGLAILVPLFKYLGIKRNDTDLITLSRKMMKWYAVTYGIAGVFGTAFTVFLFSFYPFFTDVIGNLLLVPFGISIVFIALNFFSLIAYWYGWDHWSSTTHNIIGILMGASAVMIPFGFRQVFAFLNEPVGLTFSASNQPYLNVVKAYTNPTFWPIYLKSLDGAITAGMLATMGGFGLLYLINNENKKYFEKSVNMLLLPSLIGLLLMIPLGFWYLMSLSNIPYKFNNIMGGFGWVIGNLGISYNYSWLFALSMILTAIQVLAVIYIFYKGIKGSLISRSTAYSSVIAAASAIGTIESMEMLNAFSQFPRFIASLGNQQIAALPYPWNETLSTALNLTDYNPLAAAPFATFFTSIMMAIMIVILAVFIYVIFFKK